MTVLTCKVFFVCTCFVLFEFACFVFSVFCQTQERREKTEKQTEKATREKRNDRVRGPKERQESDMTAEKQVEEDDAWRASLAGDWQCFISKNLNPATK